LLAALFADAEAWCHTTLGRPTGLAAIESRDPMHLSEVESEAGLAYSAGDL
jgi:hypothetical protein